MYKKCIERCKCKKELERSLSSQSFDGILDISKKRLSEENFRKKSHFSSIKWKSEPNINYKVNYDDICGCLPLPDHPTFKQFDDVNLKPILCTWNFITINDIKKMKRHLFEKDIIKSIIGNI